MQDVVETHLLRDIAARSENFFQAANEVQDLRGVLARSYMQVKALRHDVSLAAWLCKLAMPCTCRIAAQQGMSCASMCHEFHQPLDVLSAQGGVATPQVSYQLE